MSKRLIPALTATTFSLLLATSSFAVGTRTFQLDSQERFAGGELKGAFVDADGVVKPGYATAGTVVDASTSWSALAMNDGSVLVGTGPNGKIFRVAAGQATLFADTGALAVTSLALGAGGQVYAATIPDGKVFKVSQGKADLLATIPEASYVWSIAWAKNGLFAAVGPEGRVVRIEPSGATSVYFKSEEAHIVSISVDAKGDVLAGGGSKGILYRVTGPGRASVVADFPGTEVKASFAYQNSVYAIVNEYSEPNELPRRSPGGGSRPPGPFNAPKQKPGKGALFRVDDRGRVERLMRHDEFHYTSLFVDDRGTPFVGTGAEGRVYSADESHAVSLVADLDERQVTAISVKNGTGFFLTSDTANLQRIVGHGGADATWTGKVLDAGLPARFGAVNYRAIGAVEFVARTGNTQVPDGTWTPWSGNIASGARLPATSGRYVQLRARLKDAKASLANVSLAFATENQRAIVLDVTAQPKQSPTRETGNGTIPAFTVDVPKREPGVKITWRVDNPDNDPLRYRLAFQREGQTLWRDLLKAEETLSKTDYDWDTTAMPEGRYRVRVEASDEIANTPADVQKHQLTSDPFVIDNTPPVIQELAVRGKTLHALVVDGTSAIVRVEMAIDGRTDFRPVPAQDGIFDSPKESVQFDLASLVPRGSHLFTIRAIDAAGNMTLREVEGNVP